MRRSVHQLLGLISLAALVVAVAGCGGATKPARRSTSPSQQGVEAPAPASAQPSARPAAPKVDFPTRSITLIVPYDAGGVTDVQARMIAAAAEKHLGQPVVVENRPGGTGAVGIGLVAQAKPDGYTIGLMPTTALLATPQRTKTNFDPLKDFTYIGVISKNVIGLSVLADSPFKTFDDMVNYASANPGKVRVGTGGVGTIPHLILSYIAAERKTKYTIVPYKSSAETTKALLSGEVDVAGLALGDALPHMQAKKVRLLVSLDDERWSVAPDVKTLKEWGMDVPLASINAIGVPKGTPEPVVAKLREAFEKARTAPEYLEKLKGIAEPSNMTAKDFEAWAPRAYEAFGKSLDLVGLKGKG